MSNKQNSVYMIVNDFYMKKEKSIFQHTTSNEFFSNEEECLMKIEDNIDEIDNSSSIYLKEAISVGKIKTKETYAQRFSYNVLQYQPRLEGSIFNIGIIIWNKETQEVKYKFIKDKQLKKMIKVMPGIADIEYALEIFKREKKKNIFKARQTVLLTNKNNTELFFKYKLLSPYIEHNKDKNNINIEKVCDKIFFDKVGFLFNIG